MLEPLVRPRGAFSTGLLVLALTTPGFAAVFDVTKTEDTLDGTCDAEDCSLREALTAANETDGFDSILLPAGTYTLTLAGQAEDQARTGDLDVLDDVEILGAGADVTVIDAAGLDRVFEIAPRLSVLPGGVPLTNVAISDVTIRGGEGVVFGAGIRIGEPGVLALTDSAIRDNLATRAGGIYTEGGAVTVERCAITDNTVGGSSFAPGAALRADEGTVAITNSTISGNLAPPAGAAVFILSPTFGGSATVALTNVTIADNGTAFAGTLDGTTFFNSIVAGACELEIDGVVGTSLGGNIESPGESCFTPELTDRTSVAEVDLVLEALTLNGGPTETMALGMGSIAIDTALDAGCPAVDQRGSARPADGDGDEDSICDVGAYERPDTELLGGDLFAELTVAGPKTAGSTVTYTATIVNDGTGIQVDDPALDEFRDILPAEVSLVSADADRGVAEVDLLSNLVTWNGQLFSGEQAVVTIEATIDPGPAPTVISNQGLTRYDLDGDGANEANRVSDDPGLPGAQDATSFCAYRSSNPLSVFADDLETGDLCYWSAVQGANTR